MGKVGAVFYSHIGKDSVLQNRRLGEFYTAYTVSDGRVAACLCAQIISGIIYRYEKIVEALQADPWKLVSISPNIYKVSIPFVKRKES